MKAAITRTPADQCRELGIAVGDTIEGSSPFCWPGEKTRITLLWLGQEMAMWRETRFVGGKWTEPRESAVWDLSMRDWERIEA